MSQWLGTTALVYSILVVLLLGLAALAAGRALANTWRPLWQVFFYCLLLALAARFLVFALFDGSLLSATGLATDYSVMLAWGLLGYRMTRVRKLACQYPWLYERQGLLSYRRRGEAAQD